MAVISFVYHYWYKKPLQYSLIISLPCLTICTNRFNSKSLRMTQNLDTEKIGMFDWVLVSSFSRLMYITASQQQSTQVSNDYQLQRWLSQPKNEDSWVPMECIIGLNDCVYPKTSRVGGNKGDTSSNCATQGSAQESRRNNWDGVVTVYLV